MYSPQNSTEYAYFDSLWQTALIGADGGSSLDSELSGKAAVQFFQRSNIDTSYLKMVWSLSTPTATMNKQQFYTALRYISMIQNGDIPISKERLLSGMQLNIGLPRFSGIDVPVNPVATPGVATPSSNTFTTVASPTPAAASANNAAAYAITAIDHGKYHDLFISYDSDRDGYLTAEESMAVFRKSGLQSDLLQHVFQLADCDKDSRLTSKEFAIGFHLILCNTKKGLPVPTNGLPPMLKGFLANAPHIPGGAPIPSTSVPSSGHPVAFPAASPIPLGPGAGLLGTPANSNAIPNASVAPAASKPVSISSAFDNMDPAVVPQEPAFAERANIAPTPLNEESSHSAHRPPYTSPAARRTKSEASSIPGDGATLTEDTEQLQDSVDAIKQVARRALASQEQAVDGSDRLLSLLTNIKQKLAVDKISMEATLSNLQRSSQESHNKLDFTIKEIASLQQQLAELRSKLEEAHQDRGSVEALTIHTLTIERVNKAQLERQEMLHSVQSALADLAAAQQNSTVAAAESAAATLSASQAVDLTRSLSQQQGQLQADLKAAHEEVRALQLLRESIQKNILSVKSVTEAAKGKQATATAQLQQERRQQQRLEDDLTSLRTQINDANKQRSQIISGITEDSAAMSALSAKGTTLQQGVVESGRGSSSASASYSISSIVDGKGATFTSIEQLHDDPFADLHSSSATALNTVSSQLLSGGKSEPFQSDDDAFAGLGFDTTTPLDTVINQPNLAGANASAVEEEKDLFADSGLAQSVQSLKEDPFDSFGNQVSALPAEINSSAITDDPFQSVSVVGENAPVAVTKDTHTSDFGELSQDPFDAFGGQPALSGGDPFDTFGEQPTAATVTAETTTTTTATNDHFDAFSAEPTASIDNVSSTAIPPSAAPQLDDPFDAFAGRQPTASSLLSADTIQSNATPLAEDPFDAFGAQPASSSAAISSDLAISISAGPSQESASEASSSGSSFPAFDAFPSQDSGDCASAPSVFATSSLTTSAEVDPFAAFPTSSFAFPAADASIADPFAPTNTVGQPDLKGVDADPFASTVGTGEDLFASAPSFPSFPVAGHDAFAAFSSGTATAAAEQDPFAFTAGAAAGGADPFAAFD